MKNSPNAMKITSLDTTKIAARRVEDCKKKSKTGVLRKLVTNDF